MGSVGSSNLNNAFNDESSGVLTSTQRQEVVDYLSSYSDVTSSPLISSGTSNQFDNSADIFSESLAANKAFLNEISTAMTAISSGEDQSIEFGGQHIENINSLTGMTVFSTQMQIMQAQMDFVNNLFNFVKTFEKQLQNIGGGS